MPLVGTKEMFKKAYDGGYAIGAFNVNNMEIVQGITDAAGELKSPLILQVSAGARKYARHEYLVHLVKAALEINDIPIALHLDHGADFDICKSCIDGGFTSVMIDGSHLPYDENVALAKRVAEYAHAHGVVVEAELGQLAGVEDDVNVSAEDASYTKPEEVQDFVEKTGVDSLAIAIGTSHGVYKSNKAPELNFTRLRELAAAVPVPLVLHGGSGTGDENLRRAVREGIAKLNIYTDFLTGAMAEIKAAHTDSLIETQKAADEGMRRVLTHYINLISKI